MQIAINGVDRVGKSQQIKLLQFYNGGSFDFARPLIEYSSRWPRLKSHDMFNWWFKEVGFNEFLDIILESLNIRHSEFEDGVVILDRGTLMFKAVCATTMSVRMGLELLDSMKEIDSRFAQGLSYELDEEHNILLERDVAYQNSIKPYLSLLQNESSDFTDEENEFYLCYQSLLEKAISIYFRSGTVDRIRVDRSICDIQNELRLLLNRMAGLSLPEVCGGVRQIIGFGGLSECGKSSFAEHFYKNKGHYRLKLGYFVEVLKRRGENDTPESVAMEFLHFCKMHYYVENFTLESLHEPYTPAFLKLLFGPKFKIAYLDAPFEARCKRASVERGVSLADAEKETKSKDLVKEGRGAKIVGEIADITFNNSDGKHRENMLRFEKTVMS
ncbi:MAG: hypothetical protein V1891_03595 [bacterium]